jgi:hypothetical protein
MFVVKENTQIHYHIALHRTVKNAKCMSSNRASHCPGELQKRACSRYERRSTRPPTASGKACAPGTVQYSTVQYSTVEYSTVQYSTWILHVSLFGLTNPAQCEGVHCCILRVQYPHIVFGSRQFIIRTVSTYRLATCVTVLTYC